MRQHLAHVPTVVWGKNDRLKTVAEQQNYLLFDRMVAYHIQRGVSVLLGAVAFIADRVVVMSIRRIKRPSPFVFTYSPAQLTTRRETCWSQGSCPCSY